MKDVPYPYAPINCKPRGPPPPPPPRPCGSLTASLYPGVGNLTMRWVPGVGHFDCRQSVLWSSCAPLPDSMDLVVTHTGRCLPRGGAVWPFPLSPGWGVRIDLTPPWPFPHHLRRGGGGALGHAIDRCIMWSMLQLLTRLFMHSLIDTIICAVYIVAQSLF